MKTLVITAGDQSHGHFLSETWLPTLRRNAEYHGDVLILDYDLSALIAHQLRKDNVFIEKQKLELEGIWADRHRAIYNCLIGSYSGYDVIFCVDGKDIFFQKPIRPLLEQAKDIVCYTTERKTNKEYARLPDGAMWEAIKDKPIINGGLYGGPISPIKKLELFVYEQCKYFEVDQVWLNVLIYYFKFPSKRVEDTWNWARSFGVKKVEGVYYTPEGKQVAIFHDH